ncbi:MAG: superoxide dismutase, Ni [Gammaproteobacteria bacterium]|nr:MAG: superoxide dismutase, Ni [Gammaproteobacteria bacterium]
MLHGLIDKLDQKFAIGSVSAHCDVPCGIYDPATAQLSALTVIRLVDQLLEMEGAEDNLQTRNKYSRLIAQKEEHAEAVKHEVRIIWGDYFKAPQFEKFPQTHELVHNIMMQGSKARQNVDRDASLELLNLVNQFADIFWQTKGVATYQAKSPYLPNEMVVYPKLA